MDVLSICKALSNETRLQILIWLKEPEVNFPGGCEHLPENVDFKNGVCAGMIHKKTGLAQSVISHYLEILTKAGLLESLRAGKWTYYRRNEKTIKEFGKYIKKEL